MPNQQITLHQDGILISGDLTFATVAAVWKTSQQLFPQQDQWNCDFSQVTACDSASLALLLEWVKWARKKNRPIHFLQLPQQLQAIATSVGLSALLK